MQRPPLTKRFKRALRYGLVRVALGLVGSLPVGLAGRWGWAFGWLAFRVARTDRARALDGLRRAFPDLPEAERARLAEEAFRHLGRSAFELACVRKLDPELERWVEWPEADRRVLEAALAKGRGVLFVSGHVGNWELLARRVAMAGYPCQTIAKETTDPRLTRLVERFRAAGKLKSIWRGQDGAAKAMLKALKGGEILGMLIDQDTKVQSVHVPFFGHPASTPRAAADLALRTGAAVVMGFCQRQADGRYRVAMKEVEPESTGDREADAVALTARMTWEIEQAIRRAPAQWVWMHRRWKTQPS
ncbi:MAG TPA: lysophospholipid acyltransferase family protein [Myxococcaceae bacterium]|nr:lysophospholipid acyltransferase family protein [Myxococcaceae bacterium]